MPTSAVGAFRIGEVRTFERVKNERLRTFRDSDIG